MLVGTLSGRGLLRRRRTGGAAVQVRGRIIVELECPRKRVENLCRGVLITALLEPHVIVGTDAGKQSDLLAPEPVHSPAVADLRKFDVRGSAPSVGGGAVS
jgi:hypothetical protein